MAQPCDMDLWVMKWRSAWSVFHGPVILPYILKTIWCMYILLSEYESVRPDVWPQNKCRSLWPIIVPYTLKTISCMNIIIWDYESVWLHIWPQNKCRSLWPIFHGPVILPYILKTIWCMYIILLEYESVRSNVWPQNKCRSLSPIFHGPVIVTLQTISNMNIVHPSSVRRPPFSKIFFSKTAWHIKAKFHMEPQWDGGTIVCSRGLGHMTKMATTPIYGKNPSKIFFSRTKRPMTLWLGM